LAKQTITKMAKYTKNMESASVYCTV